MGPWGFVCFIGAGPGAADLITLRGHQLLQQADVVLFDALTDATFRAYAPQALWVDVGKRGFCDAVKQSHINALLLQYARSHHRVVRLKGGDPSVFGRLEEELSTLASAGIATQVVPGVTAAIAAAAAMQRPLTRRSRGRSVSLTTAVATSPTGEPLLRDSRSADTEVFYMAGRQLSALAHRLMQAGWPSHTPTCVVSRAGCSDQICSEHNLDQLHSASALHAGRPSIVTVGVGAEPICPLPLQSPMADTQRSPILIL